MSTPIALTIAGSDSGGGAGIQADLKTFSALGVYGASVITALTAQNTREVRAIFDVPADFVAEQLDTVCDDIRIDCVKIGMLSQPAVIDAVARGLVRHGLSNVVLDPVMVAKSGDRLLDTGAIRALTEALVPRALIVTPNLPEAGVLLGEPAPATVPQMIDAAEKLIALGAAAALVKGGHLEGTQCVDVFHDGESVHQLAGARIDTRNTHGTGCSLSSAVAAFIARGDPLARAVSRAKRYLDGAIAAADDLDVGAGHGPVHHFFATWERESSA